MSWLQAEAGQIQAGNKVHWLFNRGKQYVIEIIHLGLLRTCPYVKTEWLSTVQMGAVGLVAQKSG